MWVREEGDCGWVRYKGDCGWVAGVGSGGCGKGIAGEEENKEVRWSFKSGGLTPVQEVGDIRI